MRQIGKFYKEPHSGRRVLLGVLADTLSDSYPFHLVGAQRLYHHKSRPVPRPFVHSFGSSPRFNSGLAQPLTVDS